MRCRSAFTLIELVVVVTIIAVIASLLLPAIAQARSSAWTLRCQSNLRQLGIATATLAAEHGDYLLAASGPCYPLAPELGTADPTSAWTIFRYCDNQEFDPSTVEGRKKNSWWPVWLAPYLDENPLEQTRSTRKPNSPIFGCPLWRRRVDSNLIHFANTRWRECHPGYGMPIVVGSVWTDWRRHAFDSSNSRKTQRAGAFAHIPAFNGLVRSVEIPFPSKVPWIVETANHVGIDNQWQWDHADARHRGRANAVFVDGHVASLSALDFTRWTRFPEH